MSIEISRRNFLKTAAASLILAEGGVLTGCDSSKDNDTKNPQFVKHGKDDTFTFNDGTKVVFYDVKSSATGKDPYHAITFTFTAPDNATSTLSLSNFAAYVTAPMTCIGIGVSTSRTASDCTPTSVITTSTTIDGTKATKSKHILAKFNYVEGTPTFKITYKGQCIKFKANADSDKADKPYLSTGIYTDIF